jgi:hypothetical protein
MPANIIRLERLAFLVVLVALGIVFNLVVLIRAARTTSKELTAKGVGCLLAGWRGSRPHAPPAV